MRQKSSISVSGLSGNERTPTATGYASVPDAVVLRRRIVSLPAAVTSLAAITCQH